MTDKREITVWLDDHVYDFLFKKVRETGKSYDEIITYGLSLIYEKDMEESDEPETQG